MNINKGRHNVLLRQLCEKLSARKGWTIGYYVDTAHAGEIDDE